MACHVQNMTQVTRVDKNEAIAQGFGLDWGAMAMFLT